MSDILTHNGERFAFEAPDQRSINVTDIAHALSHLCRFTGHTRVFYSVAEHCVRLSYIVPPEDALVGLMHDATEAYLGDMSRPLKSLNQRYKMLERRAHLAIFGRLGLPPELPASVHHADGVMLMTEKRDLMPYDPIGWDAYFDQFTPLAEKIVPKTSLVAKRAFLNRFIELGGYNQILRAA